jgi:hypothetical protein
MGVISRFDYAITELWHISRTALAGQDDTSRWARMEYVKNELKRSYPELVAGVSNKQIWLTIEDFLN